MLYAPIRVEYSLAREREGGAPFLIDIEGTPETLQEMHQFGGRTRQTCTLAEAEGKGVTLQSAFAAIDADMARRMTALEASIFEIDRLASQKVADAQAAAAAAAQLAAEWEQRAVGFEARSLTAEARIAELTAALTAERAKAPAQE